MKKPVALKRPKKSAYIGVSIEEDVKASLERIAVTRDVSVGKIIREALRDYLDRRVAA